jgi:hypothetical protein
MASSLPPIPTPLPQRWRDFRFTVLPGVVFACVLAGFVAVWVREVGLVRPQAPAATNVVSTGLNETSQGSPRIAEQGWKE